MWNVGNIESFFVDVEGSVDNFSVTSVVVL